MNNSVTVMCVAHVEINIFFVVNILFIIKLRFSFEKFILKKLKDYNY
jgi:hypothetical protein